MLRVPIFKQIYLKDEILPEPEPVSEKKQEKTYKIKATVVTNTDIDSELETDEPISKQNKKKKAKKAKKSGR